MIASSLVHLARTAPDARTQVFRMAKVMVERKRGPEGACTNVHLYQAGFTEAQVVAYRDPARALLQGLPLGFVTDPPGRAEARAVADAILEVRVARREARMAAEREAGPTGDSSSPAPAEVADGLERLAGRLDRGDDEADLELQLGALGAA